MISFIFFGYKKDNNGESQLSDKQKVKNGYIGENMKKKHKRNEYIGIIRIKKEIDGAILKVFKDGIDIKTRKVILGISILEEESIKVKVE